MTSNPAHVNRPSADGTDATGPACGHRSIAVAAMLLGDLAIDGRNRAAT